MTEMPQLIDASAETALKELLERLPGYTANWEPTKGTAGWALLQVYARYLQALGERLGQAPEKNRLAFYDMLGLNLLRAQAARAPVVFQSMEQVGHGRVPGGTQVGAEVGGESLTFATENDIALAASGLAEVVSVWPGKDAYANHSRAAMGSEPFTLFEGLQPIPHEVYLAHDTYFALEGQAIVELHLTLRQAGSEPLETAWEYWDGEVWRAFKRFAEDPAEAEADDSVDGTEGLTRSGIIRLAADCAATERRRVHGYESFWIRGRLTTPLPPEPDRVLPILNTIKATSTVNRYAAELMVNEGRRFLPVRGTLLVNLMYRTEAGPPVDISLRGPQGFFEKQTSNEISWRWQDLEAGSYGLQLSEPWTRPLSYSLKLSSTSHGIRLEIARRWTGLLPDRALADQVEVDMTKTFYPFGQQPQPGTAFYLKSEALFTKGGANVACFGAKAMTPRERQAGNNPVQTKQPDELIAEYWDGKSWQDLGVESHDLIRFFEGDFFSFAVPSDATPRKINDEEGYWMRIRVVEGSWHRQRTIEYETPTGDKETMTITEIVPPALKRMIFGYTYSSPLQPPEACYLYNDFRWQDVTGAARWSGQTLEPFQLVEERTPTIYLGFDRPLPADLISLYLDIEEEAGRVRGPALRWEYWDGEGWRLLAVEDETQRLALPGIAAFVWPGTPPRPHAEALAAEGTSVRLANARQAAPFRADDLIYVGETDEGELTTVAAIDGTTLLLEAPLNESYQRAPVARARLPRFGQPRTWVRIRRQSGGEPPSSRIRGIFLNAVWAAQVAAVQDEVLGSSDGQRHQVFFFRDTPVLDGELVEVRELEGLRAKVEWPLLQRELEAQELGEEALRLVTDPRSGDVTEAWVRWQRRPNFFFSNPDERHYVLERTRGRLRFGDDEHGRIPPAGRDNVVARRYRHGGGVEGNVTAGALTRLLSGVLAQGVNNPRAAEGGADGETIEQVLHRGPDVTRHRYQAVSLADYEALAREASPAVAVARALPTTHATGRRAPGWVRLIIMPQSEAPRPQPSFELRRQVERYLAARMPAAATRLTVVGPDYLPIGVAATIFPVSPDEAGDVLEAVTETLEAFFHPLHGGPEGDGWPFGRDVYLSDVAAQLEAVPGVDYVETLHLLLDGTPRGEVLAVPGTRIVVAGPMQVMIEG